MTEQRPRPQYGEYASPEEQARAIGVPLDPAHHASAPHASASHAGTPHASAAQAVTPPAAPPAAPAAPVVGSEAATARVRRSRDVVVTVVLLGIGLAWTLLSIPGTSDLAGTLDRTYALQGYTGHYGPVALASALGLAMNISTLVLWGISCAISIALLRRHRRAFYVPLIGAVVSGLVVVALTIVAMYNDPGLLAYLGALQR
jgi:hypothetical protein